MNFYEILGIATNAPRDEIRAAYLRLARELHPDRHIGDAEEENERAKFKRIQEAYEVLYDTDKRQAYDRQHGAIPPPRPRSAAQQHPQRRNAAFHTGPVRARAGHRRDVPDNWVRRTGPTRSGKGTLLRLFILVSVLGLLVAVIPRCGQFIEGELGSSLPAIELPLDAKIATTTPNSIRVADIIDVDQINYPSISNSPDENDGKQESQTDTRTDETSIGKVIPQNEASSLEDIILNESKFMNIEDPVPLEAAAISTDPPEFSTAGFRAETNWSPAPQTNSQAKLQDPNWPRPRTETDALLMPTQFTNTRVGSSLGKNARSFGGNQFGPRPGVVPPRPNLGTARIDTNPFGSNPSPVVPYEAYPNTTNNTYGGNAYQRLEALNKPQATSRPGGMSGLSGLSGWSGWSQAPLGSGGQTTSGYGLDAYGGGLNSSTETPSSRPYGSTLSPYSP